MALPSGVPSRCTRTLRSPTGVVVAHVHVPFETVGVALRTRARVKPVYVSVGHRITLDEAASLALSLSPTYKIPEPTRLAHTLSYAGTL